MSENDKKKVPEIRVPWSHIIVGLVMLMLGIGFGWCMVYQSPIPEGEYQVHIEGDWFNWNSVYQEPKSFGAELVTISVDESNETIVETTTIHERLDIDRSGLWVFMNSKSYPFEKIENMTLILSTDAQGEIQKTYYSFEWLNWKNSSTKGEYAYADFGFDYYRMRISLNNPGEV